MATTEDYTLHSAAAQTAVASSSLPSSPVIHRRATFDVSESRRQSSRTPDHSKRSSTLPTIGISSRVSDMKKRISENLEPAKPLGMAPGTWQGLKSIIMMSWLNILLVFIPISWATYFALPHTNENDTLIFIFSFLAIIPLAKLLAFATDELSLRVGQTLAGLLNATLGNAVELIVAIIALIHCELQVVQSSLVGSILSNLLLVLGMCFFAGGVKFSEQGFGHSATQLNASLLTVSVIAVLLPAAFHLVAGSEIPDDKEGPEILSFSRGAAVILLFIYGSYLVFQLFSHKELYEDRYENEGGDVFRSTKYPEGRKTKPRWLHVPMRKSANNSREPLTPPPATKENTYEMGGIVNSPGMIHDTPAEVSGSSQESVASGRSGAGADVEAQQSKGEEEEVETPLLSVPVTVGLLVVVTVLVAVTAEWLVDSIDGLTSSGAIQKEFVGLILLPIVGNAAEHVTAVTVSVKDKLTLSLGVAVGSSIQIALFVIPFTVVLSWIMNKPLTMLFDPFESIVLFLSVLVVNYTVQDGKSNWLEGMILMCLYLIIAVTFWYYPGVSISEQIASQTLTC